MRPGRLCTLRTGIMAMVTAEGRIADVSRPNQITIRQRLLELRQPSVRDLSGGETEALQRSQPVQVHQPGVRDLSAIETKVLQPGGRWRIRQPSIRDLEYHEDQATAARVAPSGASARHP